MKSIKILVVAMVAMLTSTSCGSDENTPSKVAEQYLQLVYDGNSVEALKLTTISDKDYQSVLPYLTSEHYVTSMNKLNEKPHSDRGGVKKIKAINETISEGGQTAIVELEYSYNSYEHTTTKKVKLVSVDGSWLIEI